MDIQESVHRILARRECLADLFYLVFLDRYPEVRHHFEGVNLKYQAVLLTTALLVIQCHAMGSYPATTAYLRYLGSKHRARNIPPELYPPFRDALRTTLARFHSKDWDAGLAGQWRAALDKAVATMLEGYQQHFTVRGLRR
jgi:hemoglobin-like flavoprotein